MKKTLLAIALTTSVGAVNAVTDPMTSATFTMLDGTGGGVGLDTAVTGSIGDGAWAVSSTNTFFGQLWTAHSGTTFGPGTYSFDTIEGGIITGVEVGAVQVGGHILFDWGVTADIDVVNVWDVTISDITSIDSLQTFVSTDVTATNPVGPDGIRGLSMIDGAFIDFNANFDFIATITDAKPPEITLIGSNPQTVVIGDPYVEAEANCDDVAPQDGFTYTPVITGTVDTTILGDNFISYNCEDANANAAITVIRTVTVVPPDAVTTLLEAAPGITTPIDYECANTVDTYVDAGAQCDDPEDLTWTSFDGIPPAPPLPAGLVLTGVPFDETTPDVAHDLTWTCTDTDLNTGTAIRVVNVKDTLVPVPGPFTLKDTVSTLDTPTGPLYFESNDAAGYVDPTLEAVTDACDLTVPPLAIKSGTVTTTLPDGVNVVSSTLTYTATDESLNEMITLLEVQLRRSEPVITLLGSSQLTLNVGDIYVEQGMDVHDEQDGDLTAVTTSGTTTGVGREEGDLIHTLVIRDASSNVVSSIDTSINGARYTVSYDVTDSDTNTATQVVRNINVGAFAVGSNFTMLDAQGDVFGGTNDVIFNWDETLNTSETERNFNMTISSKQPFPFFGFVWIAHHTRAFGPGTYSFDTGCTTAEIEATGCPANSAANSGPTMTMTVPDGHVGAHILFNWNTTDNIDVVNVWDASGTGVWDRHGGTLNSNKLYDGLAGEAPDPTTTWRLVSLDVNGDGFNGSPMLDGPFQGFYANYNADPGGTAPPPEPYSGTAPDTKIGTGLASINVWGLFAGLLTLFGFRRFSKKQ